MPLGLRVLNKIERIIDEEMESIGGEKMEMPLLLNSETWKRTGRWETMQGELYKLQDRRKTLYCLAPTHEEEITNLVASLNLQKSQLPIKLYQIGKKYRDEMRPRGGLLRGKEFVMKDLYTFDSDEAHALETYEQVRLAYKRIFERLGIDFAVAEADSGAIGGTRSHEYQVLSDIGEDRLLVCEECGYAANSEKAVGEWMFPLDGEVKEEKFGNWNVWHHPSTRLNRIKMEKLERVKEGGIVKDTSVDEQGMDLRETMEGEGCLRCKVGKLKSASAIECGHTFYLGTKYSKVLNATFMHKEREDLVMGCFGIGVSRLIGAIAEAKHDKDGIVWPKSIAPYQACIIPLLGKKAGKEGGKSILDAVDQVASRLTSLYGRDEVVLDDRYSEALATRLEDAKLIGYPLVVVFGNKSLDSGKVEVHERSIVQTISINEL